MKRLKEGALLLHEIHDKFFGHHLAIHADTFSEVRQMGRSIKADLVASQHEPSRQRMCARTFPVGASHMDSGEAAVRMAEVCIQRFGHLKPGFIGRRPRLLKQGRTII